MTAYSYLAITRSYAVNLPAHPLPPQNHWISSPPPSPILSPSSSCIFPPLLVHLDPSPKVSISHPNLFHPSPPFLLFPPPFLLRQWFLLFSLPPLFLALFPLSIAPQSPPCLFPNPIRIKAFLMIFLWSISPLLLRPFPLLLIQPFLIRFLSSPLRFLLNHLLLPHRRLPKIGVHPLPTLMSSLSSANLSPTLKSLSSARHSKLLAPLTTMFMKNASRGLSLSISGNLGHTLAASWIQIPA